MSRHRIGLTLALILSWSVVGGAPLLAVGLESDTPAQAEESASATLADGQDAADGDDVLPTVAPEDDSDTVDTDTMDDASDGELPSEAQSFDGEEAGISDEDANQTMSSEETLHAESDETAEDTELVSLSTKAEADAYAKAHAADVADGRYAILTKLNSGFALDVKGNSKSDGAAIILYTAKVSSNQRWEISHVDGGYVTIKSVYSGKYLQGGWNGAAWRVVQNARNTSERGQLWIMARQSDGSYKITSALDLTRALDVQGATAKNSASVISYAKSADDGKANRRWTLSVTADILDNDAKTHKGDLADGTYLMASALGTSYVMSVSGASMDNSASVALSSKGPVVCQGWIITHDSNGYAHIINAKSGKALDVRGGKASSGAGIIQWTAKQQASRNQQWVVEKRADGSYLFISALTGSQRYALGIFGSKAQAGSAVQLTELTGTVGSSQLWRTSTAPEQYAYAHDVADGLYCVASALNANKVLDVSGNSTKEGAGVKLWTSKLSTNQFWNLSHDDQGIVHLTNYHSDKELACVSGALVQSSSSQGWVFEAMASGQYRIRGAATGTYLDVSRSNTDDKTNKVILYKQTGGKNQLWKLATPTMGADTPIMGQSQVSQAQAVRYLNNHFASTGRSLPSIWTKDGETVAKLVKYFWEEGEAEGVRGDVALAQSIHETGWFQFGGDVVPEQYNFAGIGTTGGGVKGAYFGNARTGIRAQIQHLKAYASTAALNQKCVDPRFDLVSRGVAPTIKGLSGRWAVPGYSVVNGTYIYYHDYLLSYLNGMLLS